jgi:benzoylformate decarboxylase/acetolactate synthase-1/2/3 large subunit
VDRRDFLKLAAGGAASVVTAAQATPATAQEPSAPQHPPADAADVPLLTTESPSSDFMVDVLKTLDFEYIASNPASSFRSLQESLINYGKNKNPMLSCERLRGRGQQLERTRRPQETRRMGGSCIAG